MIFPSIELCDTQQVFICPQLHSMFCVIYQLCRVRGAKAVVRLMPHEAADLEPVIHALQAQVTNLRRQSIFVARVLPPRGDRAVHPYHVAVLMPCYCTSSSVMGVIDERL